MTTDQYLSSDDIRHMFSQEMSYIYQKEVPLYSNLLSLVAATNKSVTANDPALEARLKATGQIERLNCERHGAIRLGTADEIRTMARFLNVMGMRSVGYYDLSQAGLPVHATCFRCLDLSSLEKNPFRLFVSLLRPDLISPSIRSKVYDILSRRHIFHPHVLELISIAEETNNQLTPSQASEFVTYGLETFKWRQTANVTFDEYSELYSENPLLADVAGFEGPHINHLTPRTLDIDAIQAAMVAQDIPTKDTIEGPPRRQCPILLRQTSFKALEEAVYFPPSISSSFSENAILGSHRARFGEIEERGIALTPNGRALYDRLIQKAIAARITPQNTREYAAIFSEFPDDWNEIRKAGLAWFEYYVADPAELRAVLQDAACSCEPRGRSIEDLIELDAIRFKPLIYEDFLPLSAAGIFQSNLGGPSKTVVGAHAEKKVDGRRQLQMALQTDIVNEMDVYKRLQEESLETCRKYFAL
ncbi:hypothetical protein B7463_g5883, partial [Scytalidium lignicola]